MNSKPGKWPIWPPEVWVAMDVAHHKAQRFVKRHGREGVLIHEGRPTMKRMRRRLNAFLRKNAEHERRLTDQRIRWLVARRNGEW